MPASAPDRPYVDTSVARLLRSRIELTHEERGIAVFSGPWGIGKSKALNAFAADHDSTSVVIEVEPGSSRRGASPIAVMQRVVEALRRLHGLSPRASLSNAHWTLRKMVWDSVADLFDKGSYANGALFTFIFDEAQFLSSDAIEMLRFWNDGDRSATPFPVGLVFVGNNEFALQEDASGYSVLSGAVRSRAMFVESMDYTDVSDDDLRLFYISRGIVDQEALRTVLSYYQRPRAKRDLRGAERLAAAFQRRSGSGPVTADVVRGCLGT